MSHTPGPWFSREDTGVIFDSCGTPIQTSGTRGLEQYRANARLIAAAPELVRAAKNVLEWFSEMESHEDQAVLDTLREAVAKATGDSERPDEVKG